MLNQPRTVISSKEKVFKSDQALSKIYQIDSAILLNSLKDQSLNPAAHGGWKGKCPFCSHSKGKHRKDDKIYLPAYLTPGREEGFIFHCCACEITLTTYKFLKQVQGENAAERYAQERWDAGHLCGQGWNCPLPSKEYRRDSYRRAEQEKKVLNYQKKYGSSPH